MKQNNLNKSTLSKSCDIPYTTIDGWYKKGYEGLKLTTLRKLSSYFGTTLDYWVQENETAIITPHDVTEAVDLYSQLDTIDRAEIRGMMKQMLRADKYSDKSNSKLA